MSDLEPITTNPNDLCFIDVETRSWEDVVTHGAFRHNAKARVTIVAYAIGNGEVKDWCLPSFEPGLRLHWGDAPDDLKAMAERVRAGTAWMVAHNAQFEALAFSRAMDGWSNFRVEHLIDTMTQGMRSHLPADLAGAARAIGLNQKQAAGKSLIKLFADERGTANPQSHPSEWNQFREYARNDVAAMRDIYFATMPLSKRMLMEYWASERINHRGVPVDLPFVRGAAALAARLAKTANADTERLTGGAVKTVRQNAAMLNWIRAKLQHLPEADRILTREFDLVEDENGERRSVPKYSLARENVEALMAYLETLDEREGLTDAEWTVLQLLEVRLFGASATPAKYQRVLNTVDVDGRLKGQYVYCGAAATTRFSSKGTQIHNLSRDVVGSREEEIEAIELITEKGAAAYDEIKERFGYVGKVLSRLIRPIFLADEGKMFVWCDWSSVEAIVCPWLTNSEAAEPLLDAIRANHRDPSLPDMYKVQAGKMLNKDPHTIEKRERQSHGKTVQLACQFAGGKGSLFNMGRVYRVHFEEDEAQSIIDRWRSENTWAVRFWDQTWESVLWCLENPGEPRVVGRITMVFDPAYLEGSLFCLLPNGDPLIYRGMKWRAVESKDKTTGEKKTETRLTVRKGRGISPVWVGELINNFTQGTAAALLRRVILCLDSPDMPDVVLHTHDECAVMAAEEDVAAVQKALESVMLEVPPWAEGLPLAVESTVAEFYTKTEM